MKTLKDPTHLKQTFYNLIFWTELVGIDSIKPSPSSIIGGILHCNSLDLSNLGRLIKSIALFTNGTVTLYILEFS